MQTALVALGDHFLATLAAPAVLALNLLHVPDERHVARGHLAVLVSNAMAQAETIIVIVRKLFQGVVVVVVLALLFADDFL